MQEDIKSLEFDKFIDYTAFFGIKSYSCYEKKVVIMK